MEYLKNVSCTLREVMMGYIVSTFACSFDTMIDYKRKRYRHIYIIKIVLGGVAYSDNLGISTFLTHLTAFARHSVLKLSRTRRS